MKKGFVRTIGALLVGTALAVPTALPVAGAAMVPGTDFGTHVQCMAQQLPEMSGKALSDCIRMMAAGLDCPHHTGG